MGDRVQRRAVRTEAFHDRVEAMPRARRERSRDDTWFDAANSVPMLESHVRRLSTELSEVLSQYESFVDCSDGNTTATATFGTCAPDLDEPHSCPHASFAASNQSLPAMLPAAPPPAAHANGAGPHHIHHPSVASSATRVSADARPTVMRADQAASISMLAPAPLGAPMRAHVPTARPNHATGGIRSLPSNPHRTLLTSRPWDELRLIMTNMTTHKILNQGMRDQEYVVSNMRNFSINLVLVGGPHDELSANALDLRATLIFENGNPVHPLPHDMHTPLLVGDTEVTTCNGGVAMRLKMGTNSLSTRMGRQRFRICVHPRDEAFRLRYSMLSVVSEPLRSVTKLDRKPRQSNADGCALEV